MARRRKGRDVHGIVLLDKPAGISSNQAMMKVRWLFQARKAGHTGNLDPFATGMLPICLGEACKTAGFMLDASKTYLAGARLGEATATGDPEGEVIQSMPVPELESESIREVFSGFVGEIEQVPPMYSALKHEGQRLYKLAREGKSVERKARKVTIHQLELLRWETPELEFRVHCSKGTYVRTLAEDVAHALGSCAHLQSLRRESVEPFPAGKLLSLEQLEQRHEKGTLDEVLLPTDAGLSGWPLIEISAEQQTRIQHGNPVEWTQAEAFNGPVRIYGPEQNLLALGELQPNGTLKPKRVINI